jgi:hypothetical protein
MMIVSEEAAHGGTVEGSVADPVRFWIRILPSEIS